MNKGKIIETGTHQTLLRDYPDGTYSKFVTEQSEAEKQKESLPHIDVDKINIENID